MGQRTGAQQRHRIHINLCIATELTLELMLLVKKYYEWATTPLLAIRKGIYSICIHWCDTIEDDLYNSACRQTFVTHILALHRLCWNHNAISQFTKAVKWSWPCLTGHIKCAIVPQIVTVNLHATKDLLFVCCFLCLYVCLFTSCQRIKLRESNNF